MKTSCNVKRWDEYIGIVKVQLTQVESDVKILELLLTFAEKSMISSVIFRPKTESASTSSVLGQNGFFLKYCKPNSLRECGRKCICCTSSFLENREKLQKCVFR